MRVKANYKMWYVDRLVAFAFCNAPRLSWEGFERIGENGLHEWHAGHMNRGELDNTVRNLRALTSQENLKQYRKEARMRYGIRYRG